MHPHTTAVIINYDTHREGRLNFVNWYRQQVYAGEFDPSPIVFSDVGWFHLSV